MLASQRPSEVSPTVLSQCNTFLLHRLVNDRDQDLVRRLVPDGLRSLLRELPSLPTRRTMLLGWAAPAPTLVEVQEIPEAHRPHSPDPRLLGRMDRRTGAKNRLGCGCPSLAEDRHRRCRETGRFVADRPPWTVPAELKVVPVVGQNPISYVFSVMVQDKAARCIAASLFARIHLLNHCPPRSPDACLRRIQRLGPLPKPLRRNRLAAGRRSAHAMGPHPIH